VISMLKIQAARVAEFPNLWLPTLSPFSKMLPDRPSRKVFEFLNDNLITFLEWILVTGDRVKHELEALLSRSWYS
jgi:hypothetical protein